MKTLATATALVAFLAGASMAFAIEPIPGSLTYSGHVSVLEEAPAGSNFQHTFFAANGDRVQEVYRVNVDHTVELVARTYVDR
ncbi:hypothetical protein [Ciceribacter sp. RN22]|uniref:hypothetical protein n=1 Tax=Ciceribacter sp. RN22 TaxID=2954932 RepID=UPI002093C175|nr:hypothetical protein [Ciceribacter sp. RN22]MCO6178657.1 hypothetical protein [Ciceribacter sp. RN22]